MNYGQFPMGAPPSPYFNGTFMPQQMPYGAQQQQYAQPMLPPPHFGQQMMRPQAFHAPPPPQSYYAPQHVAPQQQQTQLQMQPQIKPPPQPQPTTQTQPQIKTPPQPQPTTQTQPQIKPPPQPQPQLKPQPQSKPQPPQIVQAATPKSSLPPSGIARVASGGSFVANPTTKSLGVGQGLLAEAFGVAAHRFSAFDLDSARVITFKTIAFQLSLRGFTDRDKLVSVFQEVGVDENESVDFAEFLAMIHVWSVDARPWVFFKQEKNAQVVNDAAVKLEE
eukprot:3468355-Rhodomonas_salina.1